MNQYHVNLCSRPNFQSKTADGFTIVSAESEEEAKKKAVQQMNTKFPGRATRKGWRALNATEVAS